MKTAPVRVTTPVAVVGLTVTFSVPSVDGTGSIVIGTEAVLVPAAL